MEHTSMSSLKRQRSAIEVDEDAGVEQFLDLEAREGDDDEDEWNDLELEQFFIADEAEDEVSSLPSDFTRLYASRSQASAQTEEQELRACLERWKANREEARHAYDGLRSIADVESAGDYVYWMIHCRRGSESSTASAFNSVLPKGLWAFAVRGLTARVYVATLKDLREANIVIRHFGKSLPAAYAHRRILPLCEAERRMLVWYEENRRDMSGEYPVGTWVRIKYGQYKGDIAKVFKSSSSSDELELLVVPRLKSPSGQDSDGRDPQALFDASHLKIDDLPPGPVEGSYLIGDNIFLRNGLRVIIVQGFHYVSKFSNPTPKDIWLFTVAGVETLLETNREFLLEGDRVRDLSVDGERGLVIKVNAPEALLEVDFGGEAPRTLHMSSVERVFDVGDSVRVVLGPWKDFDGMIVEVSSFEITLVGDNALDQVTVPKSAVQTVQLEERMRNLPTLQSSILQATFDHRKLHPAMHKTVYVIPLHCFGTVCGYRDSAAVFLVHHGSKSQWSAFKASELLATDIWLKLDHTKFPGVESVKKRFKSHVDREHSPIWKLNRRDEIDVKAVTHKVRYMDTLSTKGHLVFVTDKGIKKFGHFIGANAKGSAHVVFEDSNATMSFDASGVISMWTGRRLNGEMAGSMWVLRTRCNEIFGPNPRLDPKLMKKTWRRGVPWRQTRSTIDEEFEEAESLREAEHRRKRVATLPLVDPDDCCAFIFRGEFPEVLSEYYVLLRFRAGCAKPKGVDGKVAWLSPLEGVETRMSRDVRLTYKSQDGRRVLTDFVPSSSLELCPPLLKQVGERVLVLKGEDAGMVVYPTGFAKEGKIKVGVYCRPNETASKKDERMYASDCITRVRHRDLGPPHK